MKQVYYNGSTSKKCIIVTPNLEENTVITYNVEIQERMKDVDCGVVEFVTRKFFKCRHLYFSKKVNVYISVGRNEKNNPSTAYFTSSGIKVIQNDYNSYHVKQVGEN